MTRCIYKIINGVNGKFYVGSAVNFVARKRRHVWRLRRGDHVNKPLQAAWNKYGEVAFVFCIVEEVADDADLLAAENVWLHKHVGKHYCYNIAADAMAPQTGKYGDKNSMWGKTFKHTPEAKAKISAASKQQIQSDETKAKRRKTMKGHTVSTETRLKLSASLTGDGNYWYGRKRPEHGAKVSRAVVVTTPKGRSVTYTSVTELREAMGVTPTTVNRALKSGKPITKGALRGYIFQYAEFVPSPSTVL